VNIMIGLELKLLTPSLSDDFFRFFEEIAFADHPEWGCGCYCCFFHATDREVFEKQTATDKREIAREMIAASRMQGLLAYLDEKPVGWCHFDGLKNLPGAVLFYPEYASADERGSAVVCFTIAQGYRGRGIAAALLEKAVETLKAQGYDYVEAYPQVKDTSQEHNYLGPLSMYKAQGFAVVKETEDQATVRKLFK